MEVFGWVINFFLLLALFYAINHFKRKGGNHRVLAIASHTVCIALNFTFNGTISLLLYEPVMDLFAISTNGFMNLNGLFTFAGIWFVTAFAVFYLASFLRELLKVYYRTVRITQGLFMLAPFLVVLVFLLIAGLK